MQREPAAWLLSVRMWPRGVPRRGERVCLTGRRSGRVRKSGWDEDLL